MLEQLDKPRRDLTGDSMWAKINWGALSVVVVWGIGTVAAKFLLGVFSPAGFLCLRNLVGGLILLTVVALLRPGLWRSLRVSFLPLLGLGVLMGVQMLSFFSGLSLTYANEAMLVFSTAPVWTGVIVTIAGLEVMCSRNWAGFFIALGGVTLVVLGAGTTSSSVAPARITGDLIMLASAVLFGVYMILSRPLMQRHGTLVVTAVAMVLSNVVLVPVGLGELIATPWMQLTSLHWALLAYTICVGVGYGMIMWYRSVRLEGATRTIVYQYLVPIVTLAAAVAFLHEQPTRWQLAGIAVTMGGVYFAIQRPGSPQSGPVAQK